MAVERRRVRIGGLVQGIGFRPFVYRLAQSCDVGGWVANDSQGVQLEVQGSAERVQEFMRRLPAEKPVHARITALESESVAPEPGSGFCIRPSESSAATAAILLPDLAPCDQCLREVNDPANRRFRYPFINCTECGPRFSIVRQLPYDRANTTMVGFPLCADCQSEYMDPLDRRFHAEPIACPECGPRLQLCDPHGNSQAAGEEALQQAIDKIASGAILALKGVGGFQLLADAACAATIERLRHSKHRPEKPFAMLYPDTASVQRDCVVSRREAELLSGPERPIVLLARRADSHSLIADNVAPGNPDLGVMLPCSPLHYLVAGALGRPVVCTSGNLSGEPICRDDSEGFSRLGNIADAFLTHNRPIAHVLDDSVVREADGGPLPMRRARGYVPAPVLLPPCAAAADLVAVGSDLKNCPAVARGERVYLAQHIGDLENRRTLDSFVQVIDELTSTYPAPDERRLCDLHPGYVSGRWARKQGADVVSVQHHVAHFFSCMAEHGYRGPALGICWDGTGYGADGALRGSEFLLWNGGGNVRRLACLRDFPLPGGDAAIRDPRRQAAGLLYALPGGEPLFQAFLQRNFSASDGRNLTRMLERELNSPRCSSAGRLFDAIAALLGLGPPSSFEGQAAMTVEHAARNSESGRCYPFALERAGSNWLLDWSPMVTQLLHDGHRAVATPDIAAAFHNTLARMILSVAERAGCDNVFLSGGVFQNRRLTETASALLRGRGFRVHSHRIVPPNDGGIALGQIYFTRCMAACSEQVGEGSNLCV